MFCPDSKGIHEAVIEDVFVEAFIQAIGNTRDE